MFEERQIAKVHICQESSVTRRQPPRLLVNIRAYHNLLGEFHLRELEVRVNGNLREINLTHLVGLIDVKQDVIAMLEVGKHALLSGLEVHTLRHIATVIADTVVAGLTRTEADNCSSLGTDTAAEDVACVFEVAGLIVAVAYTPTLLNEARQSLTARTVEGIVIDIGVNLRILDVLALTVVGTYHLRPHFNALLHEVVHSTLGRERTCTDTVNFGECTHHTDNTRKRECATSGIGNHFLIVAATEIVPKD